MVRRFGTALAAAFPTGGGLAEEVWLTRHRVIIMVLALHVLGVPLYGILVGGDIWHVVPEAVGLGVFAALAAQPILDRELRAALASFGLLTASALLVHLSGGLIEMHFHFFVVVAIVTLYRSWVPFLAALAYVVLHHGVFGTLNPRLIYNHPDAWASPWKWAVVHGTFILAASGAGLLNWRLSVQSEQRIRDLEARNLRLAEERMRLQAAEERERLKDDLMSTVSHELRTPLTSLVGFTELMLARNFGEAERREFLETMHREGLRLTGLINDFLHLQRIESGAAEVVLRPAPLRPLLSEAVSVAAGLAQTHTVRLEVPDDLPLASMDPERIQQVVANLLSNAQKYSPGGGEIAVAARHVSNERIEIQVHDSGLGIPREALPKIFDTFYRVESADRAQIGGTGLGLAICHRLVEAHGGTIWAESEGLGQGTTVKFTLAVAQEVSLADVLVVEDDEGFASLVTAELGTLGYSAVTAPNAETALAEIGTVVPRAIVLDLRLPGLPGESFLKYLQDSSPPNATPVIVVTVGDLDGSTRTKLEMLGARDVFRKGPGVAREVSSAVAQLLKNDAIAAPTANSTPPSRSDE